MNTKVIKKMSLEGDSNANTPLAKRILIKSLISFVLVLTLLLICVFNKEKISKLSIININVYFYIGLFFTLFSFIALVFGIILVIDSNYVKPIVAYYIYSIHDILNFVIDIVYILFFVVSFILTPTTVSGSSMNFTLYNSDKLLVWHLGYKPHKNDIVVIDINDKHYNNTINEEFYIKRIIACEGSNLKLEKFNGYFGDFYVDDVLVEEKVYYEAFKRMCSKYDSDSGNFISYLAEGSVETNVPSGYSVILGDNRKNSNDSRNLGLITNEDILGKAIFRYYSYSGNIGGLGMNIR